MNKLKINNVELAYRDEGTGQPIVFLHAFPLNQTMWDNQVAEFQATNRIITFDWPGFGISGLRSGNNGLTGFADDLASLLDELKIQSATICGLSMGGYSAFAFYRKHVDRVNALILCDTRATEDTDEGKKARYETAELARQRGASALVETMTPKLLGESTLKTKPQIVAKVQEMIETAHPEGIAQALIGMAQRPDSTDLLARITCPTLIIVGKEDKLTPPNDAEKMNQAIAFSQLQVIENAGHLPNLEEPESFNQALGNFLKQL